MTLEYITIVRRPLVVCSRRQAAAQTSAKRIHRFAGLAMAAGAAVFVLTEAALAAAVADTTSKRKDHPLSLARGSPPPAGILWIYNEAQLGPPNAPFVFQGDGLYTAGSFESAREFHIDALAAIMTRAGTTLHLSGIVSNTDGSAQGLAKYGAGTLVLSGRNRYKGNTRLYEGTLHVQGDSALGESYRALDMYSGTTLSYAPGAVVYNALQLHTTPGPDPAVQWRVDSGTAQQAGSVLGAAPIVKLGAGTLHLAGYASTPSTAVVKQGSLAIGSFYAGSVLVGPDARLEGTGSVQSATVQSGATLAPGLGATPGRLLVRHLHMQPGATLEIKALADGQSSRLHALETAKLDGRVLALAKAGDWQAHTRYTIVRAEQGFDGTRFVSAATNLPFLDPHLSYDSQHVYLSLKRNQTPLEEAGETPTEEEVAHAIDDSDTPGLNDHVIALDKPGAHEALNQLSGNWGASVASRLLEDSRFIRLAALQHTGPAVSVIDSGRPAHAHRLWQHAFNASAHRDADRGTPGDMRRTHGMVLGWTQPIGDTLHASAYLGAQQSRMWRMQHSSRAQIDSQHAGVGLAGSWNSMQWIAGAAHSWHAINSQRNLLIPGLQGLVSSTYRGKTLQLFAEAAAPLQWLGRQLRQASAQVQTGQTQAGRAATGVAPFARFAWVNTRIQGYTEQGGPAALRVQGAHYSVLFSTLGLKAAHTVETPSGIAHLQGELAWRHAGGDVRVYSRQHFRDSAGKRPFTSEGQALARRAWSLRVGLEASLAKQASLGIAYAGLYAPRQQDHGARLDVSWRF